MLKKIYKALALVGGLVWKLFLPLALLAHASMYIYHHKKDFSSLDGVIIVSAFMISELYIRLKKND